MARKKSEVDKLLDEPDDIRLVRSQPSVELKRDAKGAVQYTVKVYHDDPVAAMEQARIVLDTLDKVYGQKEVHNG